jgi:hypothetical protein
MSQVKVDKESSYRSPTDETKIAANSQQQELAAITDVVIYNAMSSAEIQMGRWTLEDPVLNINRR